MIYYVIALKFHYSRMSNASEFYLTPQQISFTPMWPCLDKLQPLAY